MTTSEGDNKDNAPKFKKKDENQEILGIQCISSIIQKAEEIAGASEIFNSLIKIGELYHYIPESWKIKAKQAVDKFWNKGKVIISTDPEKPEDIYEVSFENKKLGKIFNFLPKADQAILLQGQSMLYQINKSLHAESEEIKKTVGERYGRRGLNIVDMITTKDIEYMLDEIKEPINQKDCISVFNFWALNYDSIALLISPSELRVLNEVQRKIIKTAEKTKKDYLLLNISGNEGECDKLIKIVTNLKKQKKLKFEKETHKKFDSGYKTALKIMLHFK